MSVADERSRGNRHQTWLRRGLQRALRSPLLLLLFIVQLTLVPLAQAVWGRRQLEGTAGGRLRNWLDQVTRATGQEDSWDIQRLRNTDLNVPGLAIIAGNGLIIEIDSFVPGLLGPVQAPPDGWFRQPTTVELPDRLGTWHVYGKRLKQTETEVIVGTREEPGHAEIDSRLRSSLEEYGEAPLEGEARLKWIGNIPWDVEFAVLDDKRRFIDFYGGIPLTLSDPTQLQRWDTPAQAETIGGRSYIIGVRRLAKKPRGLILIPWEVSPEQRALGQNLLFGAGLGVVLAVATFLIVAVLNRRRFSPISLEEALEMGEGQEVEFKATFEWDVAEKKENKTLRTEALKTIVGFLNAEGGSLFIGITDDGRISGIEDDLRLSNDSHDKFELKLRSHIKERIGAAFLRLVETAFLREGRVLRTFVGPHAPAYLRNDKGEDVFFVRAGNQTIQLNTRQTVEYLEGTRKARRQIRELARDAHKNK